MYLMKLLFYMPIASLHYWASEASTTLGCSIKISGHIYVGMYVGMSVVCQIICVGGITWTKHAHAQSLFWAVITGL